MTAQTKRAAAPTALATLTDVDAAELECSKAASAASQYVETLTDQREQALLVNDTAELDRIDTEIAGARAQTERQAARAELLAKRRSEIKGEADAKAARKRGAIATKIQTALAAELEVYRRNAQATAESVLRLLAGEQALAELLLQGRVIVDEPTGGLRDLRRGKIKVIAAKTTREEVRDGATVTIGGKVSHPVGPVQIRERHEPERRIPAREGEPLQKVRLVGVNGDDLPIFDDRTRPPRALVDSFLKS